MSFTTRSTSSPRLLDEGSSVPSALYKKEEVPDTKRSEVEGPCICMFYYVYILECADGSFYIGCTNNLEKRLKQHNNSKWGAHYTKIRRPVILKYSEKFETLKEARRREAEIKSWRREKKLLLIKGKI